MRTRRLLAVLAFLCVFGLSQAALAQSTIATGSIQGRITDPRGGALNGVNITITSKATGEVRERSTNAAGIYSSGSLIPGSYAVRMEAKGFQSEEATVLVQVGITRGLNVRMFVRANDRVPMTAPDVHLDSEQVTIQGVTTAQTLNQLPVNGRSYAQLAQLEPGVQIQDGSGFAPTRNGVASVSFGGRYGGSTRFAVDGIDVSDETAGSTTQNIPLSAIQEFHLEQSLLNPATELTSSGAVNVVTRSGSNAYHGQAFYDFRDHRVAAALPGGIDTPFQRNQFGGSFGGALIPDKLFFFLAGERVKQDLTSPVLPGAPFNSLANFYSSPFRENQGDGRLDWRIKPNNYRFFYRFSYDGMRDTSSYLPNTFQPFTNVSSTPTHAVGLDFTTGAYTHSLRFGYMKFNDHLSDAVTGSGIFNPAPQLELSIGGDPTCRTPGVDQFCSGPNYLAPQVTIQSNLQIKYDVGRVYRNHVLSFGIGYNRIHGGGYASFLGLAAAVNAIAGTDPNPLNYAAQNVILGNGQGFSSELVSVRLCGRRAGPGQPLARLLQ